MKTAHMRTQAGRHWCTTRKGRVENWPYFDLVLVDEDADVYKLVDEEGQPLEEGDFVLLFANHEEADQYLRNHNIRGSIR